MMEENLRYEDSGIDPRILRAVSEMGYTQMTPIQEQAIPQLMEGKDVIGQAQTGTGKTAAFGIPMLQTVEADSRELQGMILCPTRELAIQAAEELHKFSKYMHGIRVVPIYGGQDISRQIKALKGGAQIIVGTPGRVMDHMRRHTIKLDSLKMVVLDEADEMLNMGFREDMEAILGEIPGEHQTALFSATMPQAILDITYKYQKDAVVVRITKKELTIPLVKQYYYVVKNIYKEEAISRLIDTYNLKRSIVFCNTKKMVDELSEHLKDRGYQAEGLHGDMTQKQRDFVMNRFKNGSLQVLIATDVAARGIDVDDLEAVFNYDVPQDTEYYVHRIGRTGRAGREGLAFTFAYGRDLYRIREIERVCKTKMTEQKLPKSAQVMDIKLNKLLQTAKEALEKDDYVKLQDQIEEKMEDYELDPMELLAYLVRKEIGETPEEIVMEEPRKRRSSFDDRRRRFADEGGRKPRVFGRGDREGGRSDRERSSRRDGGRNDRERSSRREGGRNDRERSSRREGGRSDREGIRGERKGNREFRNSTDRHDSREKRKETVK